MPKSEEPFSRPFELLSARAARSRALRHRGLFWLHAPVLPLLMLQGMRVRQTVPRLPEALGAREGLVAAREAAHAQRHSSLAHPGSRLEEPARSLCVIGESTAAGVGVKQQTEGVAFSLARASVARDGRAVHVQVVGQNGARAADARRVLRAQVRPCDTALVLLGVNDAVRLTRGQTFRTHMCELSRELTAQGAARVVFAGLPPLSLFPALPQPMRRVLGLRAKYIDALLRQAAEESSAIYAASTFPDDPTFFAEDGFHPSAAGYAAWAALLLSSVFGARE